jgi:hypothetical protein
MLRSKPTFGETFFRLSHGSSVAVMGQSAVHVHRRQQYQEWWVPEVARNKTFDSFVWSTDI